MSVNNVKPYKIGDKLTKKQEIWIEEYLKCDNYTTASKRAGYSGSNDNLRCVGYQNAIKFKDIINQRRKEQGQMLKSNTIAELEDIFEFWTDIIKDDSRRITDRIKASELLAKAKGAFVEKVEVKQVDTDWFIDED